MDNDIWKPNWVPADRTFSSSLISLTTRHHVRVVGELEGKGEMKKGLVFVKHENTSTKMKDENTTAERNARTLQDMVTFTNLRNS